MHEIRDWKVVDPEHIVLRTRARGWQWEVSLVTRCPELSHAQVIGWDSTDRRVCGGRGDSVVVRGNRCTVRSLGPAAPVGD